MPLPGLHYAPPLSLLILILAQTISTPHSKMRQRLARTKRKKYKLFKLNIILKVYSHLIIIPYAAIRKYTKNLSMFLMSLGHSWFEFSLFTVCK